MPGNEPVPLPTKPDPVLNQHIFDLRRRIERLQEQVAKLEARLLGETVTETMHFDAVVANSIGPSEAQQHRLPAVAADTVALLNAAQTLGNKTLTSPVVTDPLSLQERLYATGSALILTHAAVVNGQVGLFGGTEGTPGAAISLFGPSHATDPNELKAQADVHECRNADGSTLYLMLVPTGAWFPTAVAVGTGALGDTASIALEVGGKFFLLPRLSAAQAAALTSQNAILFYNTDVHEIWTVLNGAAHRLTTTAI